MEVSREKDVFTPIRRMEQKRKKIKCEIYRDSMQNYKKYAIPPAQLIIADENFTSVDDACAVLAERIKNPDNESEQ